MVEAIPLSACEAYKQTMKVIEKNKKQKKDLENIIYFWNNSLYPRIHKACNNELFEIEINLCRIYKVTDQDMIPSMNGIIDYLDKQGYRGDISSKETAQNNFDDVLTISWKDAFNE
jgi:hypothetical protein